MKIYSWNVNGFRAVLKKGFIDWVQASKGTIICLQEVKAQREQIPEDPLEPLGYQSSWAVAEKKGYSGVSTYYNKKPKETRVGLGVKKFDAEGRVVTTIFHHFALVNVYIPNGQPDHGRVPFKMAFCDVLLEHLEWLKKKHGCVLVCGDFNIAHHPIDLARPKENENTTGFLPIERAWLDKLESYGYVDIFRKFEPSPRQYTWWSYRSAAREKNIGWRLDYFYISPQVLPLVKKAQIHPNVMGSDHCPVSLELDL